MELLPKFSSSINSAFKARPSSSFFFFPSRRRTILFALVVVQLVLLRSTASAARRKENEGHLRSTTTTTPTPSSSSSSSSSSSPPPAPPLPSLPSGAFEDSGERKGGESQEHERGKTKLSRAQLPLGDPAAAAWRSLTSLVGRETRGEGTWDSSSSPPPPGVYVSPDYVVHILQRVFSPEPAPDVPTSMPSVSTTTSTPTSPRSRRVPRPTSPPPPPPASASGAFGGAADSSPSSRQGRSGEQGAQETMITEDTTATTSHSETASPPVHGEEESRCQQTGTGSQAGAIASPSPEGEQQGRRSHSEVVVARPRHGHALMALWQRFTSLLSRVSGTGRSQRPRAKPGEMMPTPRRRRISVSSPTLLETTAMIPSDEDDLRRKLLNAGHLEVRDYANVSIDLPGVSSSPQERQQGSRQQHSTPSKPLDLTYVTPHDATGALPDRHFSPHAPSRTSSGPSSLVAPYAITEIIPDSTVSGRRRPDPTCNIPRHDEESKRGPGISQGPSASPYQNVMIGKRGHVGGTKPTPVPPYAQTSMATLGGGELEYSFALDGIETTSRSGTSRPHDPSAAAYPVDDGGDEEDPYPLPYDSEPLTTAPGASKVEGLPTPAYVNVVVGVGDGSRERRATLEAAAAAPGEAAATAPEEATKEEEPPAAPGEAALEEEAAAASGAVAAPANHFYENSGVAFQLHIYNNLRSSSTSSGAWHDGDDDGVYEQVEFKSTSSAATAGKQKKHKRPLGGGKHKRGEVQTQPGLFQQMKERLAQLSAALKVRPTRGRHDSAGAAETAGRPLPQPPLQGRSEQELAGSSEDAADGDEGIYENVQNE